MPSNFFFELHENRISQIDLLIVTHFDKDHIGGVPEVLESVSVLRVIEPDYEPENPEAKAYTAYRAALDTAGITPEAISDALEVTLGDMVILYPLQYCSYPSGLYLRPRIKA